MKTTSQTLTNVTELFSRAVSAEIDAHQPIEYDQIFEWAHDYVTPDDGTEQVPGRDLRNVERLAEAVDTMLASARALR